MESKIEFVAEVYKVQTLTDNGVGVSVCGRGRAYLKRRG
jgi:hypothetical protein